MTNSITVLSMNVRGLSSNSKKRADVFHWAKGKDTSIVCFQETHTTKEVEKMWEDEWGYKCFFSHHNSRSAGVSIMFKPGFDFKVHDSICDENGRYIILDLSLFEHRLTFVSLYGLNTDEPQFFDEMFNQLSNFSNSSILLCGDWNVVQDYTLDTYNIVHNRNQNCRKKLEDYTESFELVDPWRVCFPDSRKYTWRQCSPIKQSRLDYFLVSEDIFSLMKTVKIIPGYKTDHSAIVFSFSPCLAKRGKGYWKFNSQLLHDMEYIDLVKKCIRETVSEYYVGGDIENFLEVNLHCNDQQFFEILKMKIRSISISYSINRSRKEKENIKTLEKDIQILENSMNTNPDETILASLNLKKLELENYREHMVDGLLLRSRANWHEYGEKCTKYFCKLEKKNYIYKTISELIDDTGKHLSIQSDILHEQAAFYKKLYSTRKLEINTETFFNHEIHLNDDQKESCEGNLTYSECGEALKVMKNGKSPGSDGFTVEFYKFFWKDIGPFLFRSLHFGYECGNLSDFQYQGVITCIPKEDKDRRYLNNWRPISLLNTDTKIASAAVANRLKPILPDIVSDTQKGFMKDRFMGENTRLLYDLMHYLESKNMTGLLLLVDFEKAFDSIEWEFLIKALKSFNFGPSICKWFEIFYSKAKSCVINNGHLSEFFNLSRGCRQGDPLSPYLFIIGVELLAIELKSNPNIRGVVIEGTEPLISQYADDTFLMLDGSEVSLRESLNCFESFYKVSGLKINRSKTKAVWIGSKRYSDHILCPDFNLHWSNSDFKVLGIQFSLELDKITDINFSKKIKEVTMILKSWQHRKLSLLGKVTVIKSLALSKLVHLLTSLPDLNQQKFNELNTLFYNFIWNGKSERIKRNTLIGDVIQGGLKMVHIQSFCSYLKIGWIKRCIENIDGSWQKILLCNLQCFGGARVFSLQKDKIREIGLQVKNPFWRDVLLSFSIAKPQMKICMREALQSDILNFIHVDDFPYYIEWKQHNVQYLYNLIDPETKLFFTFEAIKNRQITNNFLRYYSLISKVPRWVKDCIKENSENFCFNSFIPEDNFLDSIKHHKKLKFIYRNLINEIFVLPSVKFLKWEDKIGSDIPDWSCYFKILWRCCKSTYLKNFQYKLLHRIIPTNKFLFLINLKETKYCTFCKTEEETIEHLFYDCNKTYTFWQQFSNCVRLFFVDFELNKKNILLGSQEYSLFLNLLVVIAKKYIYSCKLSEKVPNIKELEMKIKYYYSLEKYVAIKNNKSIAFDKYWSPLQQIFP